MAKDKEDDDDNEAVFWFFKDMMTAVAMEMEEKKELKKGRAQGEEEGRVKSNKFVTNVMIMSVLHNSSHWT